MGRSTRDSGTGRWHMREDVTHATPTPHKGQQFLFPWFEAMIRHRDRCWNFTVCSRAGAWLQAMVGCLWPSDCCCCSGSGSGGTTCVGTSFFTPSRGSITSGQTHLKGGTSCGWVRIQSWHTAQCGKVVFRSKLCSTVQVSSFIHEQFSKCVKWQPVSRRIGIQFLPKGRHFSFCHHVNLLKHEINLNDT